MSGLTGVVLAAGNGTRLRPITDRRPKATLPTPVGPLLECALGRIRPHCDEIVVTAACHADLISPLIGDVALSREGKSPIGTSAGLMQALTSLDWRGNSDVLLTSSDTLYLDSLDPFVRTWDRARIRLLVVPTLCAADFLPSWRFTGTALLPATALNQYAPRQSDLVADLLRPSAVRGQVELSIGHGAFFDCGTPLEYWLAVMCLTGGSNFCETPTPLPAATTRSVILNGAKPGAASSLSNAIHHPGGTVAIGQDSPPIAWLGPLGFPRSPLQDLPEP